MEETTRCSVFIPMTNDSLRLNIDPLQSFVT